MPGYSILPDFGQKQVVQNRLTATSATFISAPGTVNGIQQGVYIFGLSVDVAGTTTRVTITDGTTVVFDTKQTAGFFRDWFQEPIRMAKGTAIQVNLTGGSPDVWVRISFMVGP